MTGQRGQSLVEFAVATSALSLLLLGTVMLANYQEVDRRLVMAGRETMFVSSWLAGRANGAERSTALHAAHFDDPGVRALTGRLLPLAASDLSRDERVVRPGGPSGLAADVLIAPLQVAGGFLGGGFDLTRAGLYEGALQLRVQSPRPMPAPFDTLTLDLRAPYALLGDAWHAGGVVQTTARAGALVPSSALRQLSSVWRGLAAPLALFEPSLARFCPGLIEADRVPEDRLGPGQSALPGACP